MQPNILIQSLMKQLQMKNPQGFNTINTLMQNNTNPQQLIQQVMGNATPEQRQNLLKQAKGYGVPEQILSKVQNMK